MSDKKYAFIRITAESKKKLDSLKVHPNQPYSEVIEEILKKMEKKQ
jgi:predicted DNA-binding protein